MKKLLTLALAIFVALSFSSVAYANGSETGHDNGNGHHDEESDDSGSSSSTATGGTGIGIGVGVGIGGDSSVVSRNTNRNSNENSAEASALVESVSGATSTSGGNNISQNVDGDNIDVKSYVHDAAPAAVGTDSISVGTFFGGIGLSHTSKFVKHQAYLAELKWALANKLITSDEFKDSYRARLKWMERNADNNDRGITSGLGLF